VNTGLLILNIGATFFAVYYLWEVINHERRRVKFHNVGAMVDRQVMQALEQNKRTRGIAIALEKMLRATTLRPKGKPPKIRHFACVTLFFLITAFIVSSMLLNNPVAGLLLGCIVATLPYQLLQFDYKRNQKKLKKQTPQFLLAVGNMFGTYGDPVIALEQLSKRLKNPLRREVIWFTDNLKYGVNAKTCVETVKSRLPDRILKDFFDDTLFYMEHGGDFTESLNALVKQTYERETAAIERSTATSSTVIVFMVLIGVYFFMLFTLTKSQPDVMMFLIDSLIGKAIVVAMVVIFIIAGYFTYSMVSIKEE